MLKWIDDNHIEGEMSDEEFMRKVNEEAKTRDIQKCGRDGMFCVYQEQYKYKGVSYLIKILRYYQVNVPLNEIRGMNSIGKWATLEYLPELKDLASFLGTVEELTGLYEFLWADTLHSGQENWTLKQMVKKMHRQAKGDIEQLPKLKSVLGAKFQEINEKLEKLLSK